MIAWRLLQVAGMLSVAATLHLVWQASPWGPGGAWQVGRLLYAGAGIVGALTLVAVGGIGANLARLRTQLDRIEARLDQRGPPPG
jgi:hypothetical protein